VFFLVPALPGEVNKPHEWYRIWGHSQKVSGCIVAVSGARPVIVINTSDLMDDPISISNRIIPVSSDIPAIHLRAIRSAGIDGLELFPSTRHNDRQYRFIGRRQVCPDKPVSLSMNPNKVLASGYGDWGLPSARDGVQTYDDRTWGLAQAK